MKEIPLTRGCVALVDDADYESLSAFKWYASATYRERFYAYRRLPIPECRIVGMHRVILSAAKGMSVDHINGDTLDNRRGNLRVATHSQNLRNRGAQKNNKSGYKGVSWNLRSGRWIAQIRVGGKGVFLGRFISAQDAHAAYCAAAKELHGEFARTA